MLLQMGARSRWTPAHNGIGNVAATSTPLLALQHSALTIALRHLNSCVASSSTCSKEASTTYSNGKSVGQAQATNVRHPNRERERRRRLKVNHRCRMRRG